MKTAMCIAMGLFFVLLCGHAEAEILTVSPSETAVAASAGDGWTRAALRFDLSGMREGAGRKIIRAHLEWMITGVPADEISYSFYKSQ